MKFAIASAVVLTCLSGCASMGLSPPKQVNLTNTFNQQEVEWSTASGTASISGQAFFQTRGGQPRTCAGLEVFLQPHSTYGDERLVAIYGNAEQGSAPALATRVQFIPDDSGYKKFARTSTCDAQGNFSFSSLPAGKYFITASVIWTIPGQEFAPPQGGALLKTVTLGEGESKRVILTP